MRLPSLVGLCVRSIHGNPDRIRANDVDPEPNRHSVSLFVQITRAWGFRVFKEPFDVPDPSRFVPVLLAASVNHARKPTVIPLFECVQVREVHATQ